MSGSICLVWSDLCSSPICQQQESSIGAFSKYTLCAVSMLLVTAGIWFCTPGTSEELEFSQKLPRTCKVWCLTDFRGGVEAGKGVKTSACCSSFFYLLVSIFGQTLGVLEFSSFFSPAFTATYIFQEQKKEQGGSGNRGGVGHMPFFQSIHFSYG